MKRLVYVITFLSLSGKSYSQSDIGLFKFSVRTASDSLINDYQLIVIDEKTKDTLKFESGKLNQPLTLPEGSYEIICFSGSLNTNVVGLIIYSNHMTFHDFKLENESVKNRIGRKKKRKNK